MAKRRAEGDADGAGGRASPVTPLGNGGATEERKDKFTVHLKALNQQFAKWVAAQATKCPGELWRDGVKDYMKHADKLISDFEDVCTASPSPAPALTPSVTPASKPAFGGNSMFAGSTPGFRAATPGSTPAVGVSSPAPVFGSSGPFGFGGGASPGSGSDSKPPPFGFPSASAAAPARAEEKDKDGDNGEDDAERESSPGLKDDKTEKPYDVLWSAKSKLFLQPEGTTVWNDIGVGTFSLRRMKESTGGKPPVPYLVFMSNAGRALVNASLFSGLTPTVGKNPKMVIMKLVVIEDGESKSKSKMTLFKFGKDELAAECKSNIEKYRPE